MSRSDIYFFFKFGNLICIFIYKSVDGIIESGKATNRKSNGNTKTKTSESENSVIGAAITNPTTSSTGSNKSSSSFKVVIGVIGIYR